MSPIIGDFVSGQSNVTYTRMRMLLAESGGGLQEGVVGTTDLKGQQRAAGANMSIEAPPGAGWVTIDTGTRNGIGHGFIDATQNPAVAASNGTNPRIDQLVMRWNDTAIPTGTGGNVPTIEVITGTATAGATLDNRTGAAALPNDCLRLADILVPAASTSVVTANIRDRRPWARGASWNYTKTTGDLTIPAAFTAVDANATSRLELSGTDVRICFSFEFQPPAAGGRNVQGRLLIGGSGFAQRTLTLPASTPGFINIDTIYNPAAGIAAGSQLMVFQWTDGVGDTTGRATALQPVQISVQEIVRQNANNGTS